MPLKHRPPEVTGVFYENVWYTYTCPSCQQAVWIPEDNFDTIGKNQTCPHCQTAVDPVVNPLVVGHEPGLVHVRCPYYKCDYTKEYSTNSVGYYAWCNKCGLSWRVPTYPEGPTAAQPAPRPSVTTDAQGVISELMGTLTSFYAGVPATPRHRRACPYCTLGIPDQAWVCPHCRSDLMGGTLRR